MLPVKNDIGEGGKEGGKEGGREGHRVLRRFNLVFVDLINNSRAHSMFIMSMEKNWTSRCISHALNQGF